MHSVSQLHLTEARLCFLNNYTCRHIHLCSGCRKDIMSHLNADDVWCPKEPQSPASTDSHCYTLRYKEPLAKRSEYAELL